MAVSVNVLQTRSLVENNYRVTNTITTSSGIVKEVFVKRVSTEEFDRVATVADMLYLGDTPDPTAGYYRVNTFYKDFEDVGGATLFASSVKDRLELLVDAYDDSVNGFLGGEETGITS